MPGAGEGTDLRDGPAEIDAETSSGRVVLPPGLLRVSEQSATRVQARPGRGGDTITVRTSNGEIVFTALF